MTTIIGIDLSLSSTGLVSWRDGRIYTATVETPAGWSAPVRHHHIVNRVLAQRDPKPGRTLAVVEARIKPSEEAMRGTSTLDLAELRGVVAYGLYSCHVAVAQVHPATLKLYATGNGHASKEAMFLAARGRLGSHAFIANHDEADALWLLAMALHRYGAPLCAMPKRNTLAVDRPQWPTFTIGAAS